MSRLKVVRMRNAFVGPWTESPTEIQFCTGWSRQGLFIEPTCRGSFIQSFPLGWKGHISTKKLAADILGPSPTLEDKLLHHTGTIYASEDWRDPFCPIFRGSTENSQVPLGIGSNAPNPLGPWKWELREGSREAVT